MSRILLFLTSRENERLLAEYLSRRYEVVRGSRQRLDEPFDLAIVDGPSLSVMHTAFQMRKERERPVILPFLLVTTRAAAEALARHFQRTIDEVILTPVEKAELRARVEVLLRLRGLSLELHKRAEDLSARLGRVLDDSPDEIYIFDAATLRFVQVNRGAVRNTGYTMEELLRLTPTDLAPDLTREQLEERLAPLRTGERNQVDFETEHRRKDGTRYPVEVRVQLSRTETPPVFVAVVRDITERKRAEQELELAHRRALQAEIDKKLFAREVLRAVTFDRFQLVDPEEIPEIGELLADLPIRSSDDFQAARRLIESACREAGMDPDAATDFVLAAGEAIGNAVKHAVEPRWRLYRAEDRLAVRVMDRGPGIRWLEIPATLLTPGFSTKISLGLGYTLIVRLTDRVWLSTGPEGTVVQLEKSIRPLPERDERSLLLDALERF